MATKGFFVILDVSGSTRVPILPGAWEANFEDAGWFTARNQNNKFFHLREMIDGSDIGFPNRSLFAAAGERSLMKTLYDYASSNNLDAWTVKQLRNDSSAKAQVIKTAWKEERQQFSGSYVGERIALRHSMAGFGYPQSCEETKGFDDLTGSIE